MQDFPFDLTAAARAFDKRQRKRSHDRQQAPGRRKPSAKRAKPKPMPPEVHIPKAWPQETKAHWLNALCVWLGRGRSLASFCEAYPDGPSMFAWFDWMRGDAILAQAVAGARENGADCLAEETVSIADEVKDAGHMDSARVNAARLRVDARKWVASKLKPKTYADRIETVTTGTVTMQHTITDEERAKALALILGRDVVSKAPNLQEAQRRLAAPTIDGKAEKTAETAG